MRRTSTGRIRHRCAASHARAAFGPHQGRDRPAQVLRPAVDDTDEPSRRSPLPSKGFPLPMALRVTRPTAAPVDPRDAAAAALVREDLAAYRTLFADAGAREDVHERYAARKAILEAGLEGPRRETAKGTAQRFVTVAGIALDALEAQPAEPVFLNYAGIALYELGSYTAAEALFRAAYRLSPTLPHVRENLDALVARRRSGNRPPGNPPPPSPPPAPRAPARRCRRPSPPSCRRSPAAPSASAPPPARPRA